MSSASRYLDSLPSACLAPGLFRIRSHGRSHFSNAQAGEQRGLELVHTIVSSADDWDRYEGLQWLATAEYARAHPDDPDLAEVIERVNKERAAYLRWGRDTLNWAIYVFRSRPEA